MADAKITIGADASAMERARAAAVAGWRDAASSMQQAFASAARSIVSDLGEVALAQGRVNFSAQHAQVREFESVTARVAAASGRDFEAVRSSIEAVGLSLGKRPSEVASWVTSVGALTYSFDGAADGLKGISALAAETGRRAQDYQGLAVTLGTVGHVAGDTTHAIGVLSAQAKELGVSGGVAAFANQIEVLRGTISQLSISSEQDFLKVTALASALGKGFSPDAAARVQQGALGTIASDPVGFGRYLGRRIDDDFGHIKDPTEVLRQITEKVKRTYGSDARRVLQLNFGAETGAALYRADFKAAAQAAGLTPSTAPEDARKRLQESDAGKREAAAGQLEVSSRELLGSSTKLGAAADALQRFAANNPLSSTLVSTALGTGLSAFLSKFGSSLFGKAAGAGGAAINAGGTGAGVGIGGALGSAAAVAAAGVAGYAIGSYADDKLGLSDRISGTGVSGRLRADADRQFAAGEGARQATSANIRAVQTAVRASGATTTDVRAGSFAAQAVIQRQGAAGLAALAGGGQGQLAALIAELKREGKGDADAQRIAAAVAEALKNAKWTVVNSTGGPVEVAEQGSSSAAAGSQAHP